MLKPRSSIHRADYAHGSGTLVEAKVVIQALICSDSYQKIIRTVDAGALGNGGDNSEIKVEEWHTKEKSATLVQAIMVRVDDAK